MKKKFYIILSIIFAIIALVIYLLWSYESHTGVINTIDTSSITIIGINGEKYILSLKNIICTDDKWKMLRISDLKIGDTIHIINKKGTIEGSYPTKIPNVKYIKLIGRNLQTISKRLCLVSLNSFKEYSPTDEEWINILDILDATYDEQETVKVESTYVPKGNVNYQCKNNNGEKYKTIIEVFDNEIYIIRSFYLDNTQLRTKVDNEKYVQLKNILSKYE